jgi:hypothetical protein
MEAWDPTGYVLRAPWTIRLQNSERRRTSALAFHSAEGGRSASPNSVVFNHIGRSRQHAASLMNEWRMLGTTSPALNDRKWVHRVIGKCEGRCLLVDDGRVA